MRKLEVRDRQGARVFPLPQMKVIVGAKAQGMV